LQHNFTVISKLQKLTVSSSRYLCTDVIYHHRMPICPYRGMPPSKGVSECPDIRNGSFRHNFMLLSLRRNCDDSWAMHAREEEGRGTFRGIRGVFCCFKMKAGAYYRVSAQSICYLPTHLRRQRCRSMYVPIHPQNPTQHDWSCQVPTAWIEPTGVRPAAATTSSSRAHESARNQPSRRMIHLSSAGVPKRSKADRVVRGRERDSLSALRCTALTMFYYVHCTCETSRRALRTAIRCWSCVGAGCCGRKATWLTRTNKQTSLGLIVTDTNISAGSLWQTSTTTTSSSSSSPCDCE